MVSSLCPFLLPEFCIRWWGVVPTIRLIIIVVAIIRYYDIILRIRPKTVFIVAIAMDHETLKKS